MPWTGYLGVAACFGVAVVVGLELDVRVRVWRARRRALRRGGFVRAGR